MIKLETRFHCACPAVRCENQLAAANWDTALAEVRLMRCRTRTRDRLIIYNLVLTDYDEKGCLADLDLLRQERRKMS